jgi:prepilin-type N-terminal cleavage/methylation domain-containing protein
MKLNKMAFTLIELLVVVLIIGILAAIALPHYQKAVWRSRAAQLQQSVRDLANAQEMYFLVHGRYPSNFDELDISFDSLPVKPETSLSASWRAPSTNGIRANDIMELVINNMGPDSLFFFSTGVFIKGKFTSAGFLYTHSVSDNFASLGKNRLYCVEVPAKITTAGDFCNKIMGFSSTTVVEGNSTRFFLVN